MGLQFTVYLRMAFGFQGNISQDIFEFDTLVIGKLMVVRFQGNIQDEGVQLLLESFS